MLMSAEASSLSVLFGNRAAINVSRALGELQARRPVTINAPGEALFILPVEGLDDRRLAEFVTLCRPSTPDLVITQQRALAIGLGGASAPMVVQLPEAFDARKILNVVAARQGRFTGKARAASSAATAAIQLIKRSRGLPAILAADTAGCGDGSIVSVDAEAVRRFSADAVNSLTIASEAMVPLASGTKSRFIVFRDATFTDQVAIVVGTPDFAKPVPVRLHSACLTGDVFGSRRCDCGDQLALALARLEDLGGGVILYLAQEGRGVGLANKMRTYQLQDDGLDTVDANTTLGFDDDERDYGVAARMLEMLECTRVILLTNNPTKLDRLSKAGIEIVSRMALEAPINADNRRYMTAKVTRAGHRLGHLVTSLGDPS